MDEFRSFRAACSELQWDQAAASAPARDNTFKAALRDPAAERALLEFLWRAPLPAQAIVREKFGDASKTSLHHWRSGLVAALSQAHLSAADEAAGVHQFEAWLSCFGRALALPPQDCSRSSKHALLGAVGRLAFVVGEIESASIVAAHPELDLHPGLHGPHVYDIDGIMGPAYTGVRTVAVRAVAAIADSSHYSDLAPEALRLVLRRCRWPSLRELGHLLPEHRRMLEAAETQPVPTRARRHLIMVLEGRPFPQYAPTDSDDVEF
jgi:hypothetical protein